jgi:hypothetical protein
MTLARWPDADANDVVSGAETASELDLYGNASPDVTGHYVKVGTQDGVSSFARQGEVDGLAYHLYRSTWDYQGQTYTAWFLTTQASGYPSDADPWWYRYAHELGPMQPSAGATGQVTHLDPAAVNHEFAVEEITEPGEWWLDRATGKLYLWPPAGFAQSEVTVSIMADPLVELQGASFVELRETVSRRLSERCARGGQRAVSDQRTCDPARRRA